MKNEKQIDEILAEVKIRLMKENEPVNGVWYKSTKNNCKIKFTSVDLCKGYGLTNEGLFESGGWGKDNLTPMTEPEFFEMLKNHAIKLGFKSGVTVDRSKINPINICYGKTVNISDNNFEYDICKDAMLQCIDIHLTKY